MNIYSIVSDKISNELNEKIEFIYSQEVTRLEGKKLSSYKIKESLVFVSETENNDMEYISKVIKKNGGVCVSVGVDVDNCLSIKYPFIYDELISLGINKAKKNTYKYIGGSEKTKSLINVLNMVGNTNSTALIMGESGVGKEVASHTIHNISTRKKMPFVAINCGAIPENLFESELFGYEKGAFTGAFGTKEGRIEQAEGGTLFLDEIGEMPMLMQTKLLRVLQERKVQRVGGKKEIDVDIRLITATNADLKAKVQNGEFREDLYYRLNIIPINIEPLRNRRADIWPLVEYFSKGKMSGGLNIDNEAKKALVDYRWPGNVREVGNIVERLFVFFQHKKIGKNEVMQVLSDTPTISVEDDHLSEELSVSLSVTKTALNLKESVAEYERSLIEKALSHANGVVKEASVQLGVKRTTMLEKMKRMGIQQ